MKKAFTLAEVLITLTILGVVAAITVPSLIQKQTDRETVTKVKEAYAIMNTAFDQAIAENGNFKAWKWPNPNASYNEANSNFFSKTMAQYLSTTKVNGTCFTYAPYFKTVTGDKDTNGGNSNPQFGRSGCLILKNGMRFAFNSGDFSGAAHGGECRDMTIQVDINGIKGPNRWGYDIFEFGANMIAGVRNIQASTTGAWGPKTVSEDCNPTVVKTHKGTTCALWIIKKGNVDYKYRNISKE